MLVTIDVVQFKKAFDLVTEAKTFCCCCNLALLVILVVNVRQSSLLWQSLHFVSPSYHEAVHHVHRIVSRTFQHKPAEKEMKNLSTRGELKIFLSTCHRSCPTGTEDHSLCICAQELVYHQGPSLKKDINSKIILSFIRFRKFFY